MEWKKKLNFEKYPMLKARKRHIKWRFVDIIYRPHGLWQNIVFLIWNAIHSAMDSMCTYFEHGSYESVSSTVAAFDGNADNKCGNLIRAFCGADIQVILRFSPTASWSVTTIELKITDPGAAFSRTSASYGTYKWQISKFIFMSSVLLYISAVALRLPRNAMFLNFH